MYGRPDEGTQPPKRPRLRRPSKRERWRTHSERVQPPITNNQPPAKSSAEPAILPGRQFDEGPEETLPVEQRENPICLEELGVFAGNRKRASPERKNNTTGTIIKRKKESLLTFFDRA